MTPEEMLAALREWREFYGVAGTVAATLLGLLFVAIALNSDLILAGDRPHTKLRAEQAFQNYIAVLLISLLFLFPRMDMEGIVTIVIAEAAAMIAFAIFRMTKSSRTPEAGFSVTHHWRRLLLSLVAYGVMVYGGSLLNTRSDPKGLSFIGIGTILLMVSATITSWELLIRVAEIRHAERK